MAGVDFRELRPKRLWLTRSPPRGGRRGHGLRRRGVWGSSGGFLPVEAAVGHKLVAGAYFRARGACTLYDPKVILSAKNPLPYR